ncbi:hypothetical protein F441_14662 [Phytophthora nicotianae CJ01A1]|uniref:Uncharacterized protein n=1 Tax=Phytophthora nicotianae CJ01A1 TaxID=1317063 RepID=W2WGH6_PHYNI|nr:hypothetical protein F441_14662 [Phytophthora nicotianae CJ01A1]
MANASVFYVLSVEAYALEQNASVNSAFMMGSVSRSRFESVILIEWRIEHLATLGTTVAGEIFQQDRWMISSDEESSEPNKRVVDTQDRAQRNSEGSQTEKTRGHEEE